MGVGRKLLLGSKPVFTKRHRRDVAAAVDRAEDETGLQICVYLGPVKGGDSRAQAESMFVQAGMDSRPAVLMLVAPTEHKVELVTAPDITKRLSDEACARCIEAMTPSFRAGKLAAGLIIGIECLSREAGHGTAPEGAEELPDLLDGS